MTQWQAPAPEELVYVIGDIHGCIEKLSDLLAKIDDDIASNPGTSGRVIFVGDYIDRGEDSATVLRFLADVTRAYPDRLIGLMGNHERMMLDFLADPTTRGPRWMRAGAGETLRSHGVATADLENSPEYDAFPAAAHSLRRTLPKDTIKWLEGLPLSWSSGNLWVVHAGADPSYDMEDQSARVLLWGHPEFDSGPRDDDLWIAHGHTEMDLPIAIDGRICVDTGAWRTGRLTACAIRPDGRYDFLQT